MNTKTIPSAVLDFANAQIDQLTARETFTLSEITTVVDALFAMSGSTQSGSQALVYVLTVRALRIVLNADSTMSIVMRRSAQGHIVPRMFQVDSWLSSVTVRRRNAESHVVVPVWQLKPACTKIAVRSVVWLKREGVYDSATWVQMQTDLALIDYDSMSDNRSLGVVFPAIVDGVLQVMQMPASQFEYWQTLGLNNPIRLTYRRNAPKSAIEVATEGEAKVPAETILGAQRFYKKFVAAVTSDVEQLSTVPERERGTLTHVMINGQRELHDLNKVIFQ